MLSILIWALLAYPIAGTVRFRDKQQSHHESYDVEICNDPWNFNMPYCQGLLHASLSTDHPAASTQTSLSLVARAHHARQQHLKQSTNGRCGYDRFGNGLTCKGYPGGSCCSRDSFWYAIAIGAYYDYIADQLQWKLSPPLRCWMPKSIRILRTQIYRPTKLSYHDGNNYHRHHHNSDINRHCLSRQSSMASPSTRQLQMM